MAIEEPKMNDLIEKWKLLKETKDNLEREANDVKAEIDQVRDKLFKLMEASGVTSIKTENETVYMQAAAFGRPLKPMEEIIEWFDSVGHPEIAPRVVKMARVKEYVALALKEDKPLPPQELMDLAPIKELRMRRGR